jgi:hypothetical protein
MNQWMSTIVVLALTLLSGVLDARGFLYASRAWPQGSMDIRHVLLSLAFFGGGISLYIVAVRFMQHLGVGSAALQTGVWFIATAVALALVDGSIGGWTRTQQLVGIALAAGLAWLLVTTSGTGET